MKEDRRMCLQCLWYVPSKLHHVPYYQRPHGEATTCPVYITEWLDIISDQPGEGDGNGYDLVWQLYATNRQEEHPGEIALQMYFHLTDRGHCIDENNILFINKHSKAA